MEHLNVLRLDISKMELSLRLVAQPAPSRNLEELEAAVEEARSEFFRLKKKHSRMLAQAITAMRSGQGRHAARREQDCRTEMLLANRDYQKAVRLLREFRNSV